MPLCWASPTVEVRRGGSGGAGVVQFDVVERDQVVLDERQGRELSRRLGGTGVVEEQDGPAAVRLEEDVPDEAVGAELGDPAAFGLQVQSRSAQVRR
jgi:hypothetical protein